MLYAAYGSNLHPMRLGERVPSARLLGTAALPGWGLRFHKRSVDGSGKCNLVPAAGAAHVAVYEMAAAERGRLDRAEGLGVGYRIEQIDVAGFGECFTYLAMASHIDDSLRPYTWYRELVRLGCEHLGFPRPYIDGIAAIPAEPDPDRVRHAAQMALARRARSASGGSKSQ